MELFENRVQSSPFSILHEYKQSLRNDINFITILWWWEYKRFFIETMIFRRTSWLTILEEYCLHSCQQRGGQVRQAVGLLIAVTSWWTVGGRDDKEGGNNADAINLRQYRRVLPRLPQRWANEGKERDEDSGERRMKRRDPCVYREIEIVTRACEAGRWYFAMVDTKGFEHGCGESFRKMSANAWVIS